MGAGRTIEWVVFDLGETLVNETENWGRWADYLGVPRLTFFALLGSAIADRRPHTDVFEYFRPGFDMRIEAPVKVAAGYPWSFSETDLYPDALPTLRKLRNLGYRTAVMANQPLSAAPFLTSLPVDKWATSDGWQLHKPDPAFFERVAAETGVEPGAIAYVGDRIDNDIIPAQAIGMLAVHLRRGPWGLLHAEWAERSAADICLDDLTGLADALKADTPARPERTQ